jgi:hypothetical protein
MSAAETRRSEAADEAALQAKMRLDDYERVVRQVQAQGECPPVFNLTGLDMLFTGSRQLEDLVRRPFTGRCTVKEKGAPDGQSSINIAEIKPPSCR